MPGLPSRISGRLSRGFVRGQGEYSPDSLRSSLRSITDQMRDGAVISQPANGHVRAYYDFYGIDFRDTQHAPSNLRISQAIGWLPVRDFNIAVQIFAPENSQGKVLVCHGYYDHVGLYGHLIEYLLSHNLTVVCFDQPGHGLSSGPAATIDSFSDYVNVLTACVEQVFKPLTAPQAVGNACHLVGQSMGGAVATEYLYTVGVQEFRENFNELVLFAPLVRPALWSINRAVYEVAKRTITERPRAIAKNADNPEFISLMHKDPLQAKVLPVQWVTAMVEWMTKFERRQPIDLQPKIVQGHTDFTVDWRYNLSVLQRLTQPDILHIATARHQLVNEAADIREQIWRWLDGRCSW